MLKEWKAELSNLATVIGNVINMLHFLEILEEFSWIELQGYSKNKLISLLEQQRIYLKQRGTIKWVKLGDAETKFFHVNSIIRYRGNLISQLSTPNGTIYTSHSQKDELIWRDFKERFGSSEFISFMVEPGFFTERHQHLDFLHEAFSEEEIDKVI